MAVQGSSITADGDERSRALQEILSRSYEATSADGRVTVLVAGDERISQASVHDRSAVGGSLSWPATEAVQNGLNEARAATARAMADLPGLNPQLRALLLGGS